MIGPNRDLHSGHFGGAVKNPQNVEKGVVSLTVDGVKVDGHVIPYVKGKTEYNVTVTMG